MSDYRTFVVPYDFSPHARKALSTAMDLATRLGADLQLVYVVQPPSYAYGYAPYGGDPVPLPIDMIEVRQGAERSLQDLVAGLKVFSRKVEAHVVEGTSIAEAICELAHRVDADLIVMGTHGHTGLTHVFLGSVAERTLRSAVCPVLSVRGQEGDG